MASPTIAALRAASSAAPAGPSGPQALNYAWMNTPGRAVVVPVRSSVPPPPKRGRPPDPTTGLTANDFRKATEPPLPPAGREGRVTNDTPGFVDGLTLPRDYNPTWNFNPNLLEDLMPENFDSPPLFMPPPPNPDVGDVPQTDISLDLLEYMNSPRAEMGEATDRVQFTPQQEVPVSSSQMGAEPQLADFQLQEFIQPVPMAEAPVAATTPAVEVAPESIPYMPQIVEPEAPQPAPVRRPKVPQPLEQPGFDQELLQYLMMSEFGGPNLQ